MGETMRDRIRDLVEKDVFSAFDIITVSGERYHIQRPTNLAIGKTTLHYFYPGGDRYAVIKTGHITRVDVLETA